MLAMKLVKIIILCVFSILIALVSVRLINFIIDSTEVYSPLLLSYILMFSILAFLYILLLSFFFYFFKKDMFKISKYQVLLLFQIGPFIYLIYDFIYFKNWNIIKSATDRSNLGVILFVGIISLIYYPVKQFIFRNEIK